MTHQSLRAAERETYSIMEYKRSGRFVCWLTKIGYNRGKGGEGRVRAWQYHGKDYAKAQKAALSLAEQWEAVVAAYKRRKAQHDFWVRQAISSARIDGYYLDEDDNKVPLDSDAALQRYRAILDADAPEPPVWPNDDEPPKRLPPPVEFRHPSTVKSVKPLGLTVGDAKQRFVADYEGRIALQGKRAIKQRTFRQTKKMLSIALRALDSATPVADLDYTKVKAVADYWQAKERGISERTSNNYLRAFKQFLDELPRIEPCYPKPDFGELFTFRKVKGTIAKYDPEQIKALLNAVDDRCKLFQLLALNCGFYQVDICNLRADEIVTVKGEAYIVRKRDKSSHQNDFTSQWWLFPETAKLLGQFRALDNAAGLAPSTERKAVECRRDEQRSRQPAMATSA